MRFQLLNFSKTSSMAVLLGSLVAAPVFGGAPLPARPNQLTDLAGKTHWLAKSQGKATVLVFVAHDCPISNGYAPEIQRIAAAYAPRGVQLLLIYADGSSAAVAQKHARQFGLHVPLVLDAKHQLSASLGATVTPEAAVLSPSGQVLYLGRINNRYATWGKTRSQTTSNDLREALDATLNHQPVPHPVTRAVGCFIPDAVK